jgi:hypothetical protein
MAPFRSSRSTRNNDPATLNRGRGGVIDHDPTEGLPVRNWYLGNINVKQDEPVTNDDEQQTNANTINPDFPWPELPLPSFFSELPPLSQQIVRVSRSERPVKPSVYDKKTGTYISHAEYAARNTLKSKHLENVDSPAADDDEEMDEDLEAKIEAERERIFTMRKWAQVPPAVADRRPEPKYLADRRPGMRSLYGFQAAALNSALNVPAPATAGIDLGDGSGLGNATGVLAAGTETPPVAVASAKRMPPKRKKKGGPGRKRANLGPGPQTAMVGAKGRLADGVTEGESSQAADGSTVKAEGDTNMEDAHDGDDHQGDEGSGSDEEGSEEGEIDEGHLVDTEMKVEEVVDEPAVEPTQPEEPTPVEPAAAATDEEATVDVVESLVAPAETPTVEETAAEPEQEQTQPVSTNEEATVDLLGSLDDAVADMEKKEEQQ